jgi:hypothetical protein
MRDKPWISATFKEGVPREGHMKWDSIAGVDGLDSGRELQTSKSRKHPLDQSIVSDIP